MLQLHNRDQFTNIFKCVDVSLTGDLVTRYFINLLLMSFVINSLITGSSAFVISTRPDRYDNLPNISISRGFRGNIYIFTY